MQRGELRDPFGEVRCRRDRVTTIDRLCFVARQLHRHRARDASALEVSHCSAPKIVHQTPIMPRLLARDVPRRVIRADRTTVAVEHMRDDALAFLFERCRLLALCVKQLGERREGSERKLAALTVLGNAWLQSQDASVQINAGDTISPDLSFARACRCVRLQVCRRKSSATRFSGHQRNSMNT